MAGKLVISLDFELFWGVRDCASIDKYGSQVKNEQIVVPKLLELFTQYNISVTWAIVGLLLCKDKAEIVATMPKVQPGYTNYNLNPYLFLDEIGNSELDDPYYYGISLAKMIQQTPNQEIATHTFGHYYCLEAGQTLTEFAADLEAAREIARRNKIVYTSIVFPRNQYTPGHLAICHKSGLRVFRGNEDHWAYIAQNSSGNQLFKRAFRLVDSYINLSGDHTYPRFQAKDGLVNVPASRFLRPYSTRFKWLEGFKLRRIQNSMTQAAKHNQIYHLWWHPHNFGKDINDNLSQLEWILKHFIELKRKFGMQSVTMGSFAD